MSLEAQTTVVVADPGSVLGALLEHLKSHDLNHVDQGDGNVLIPIDEDSRILVSQAPQTLTFAVWAPSPNKLFVFKEGVVRHLEELTPEAAASIRWSDDLQSECASGDIRPPNFHLLHLSGKGEIFPGMLRLTFACKTATSLQKDGIHVKLMLPSDATRAPQWPHVASNGATLWPKGEDELHVRYYTLKDVRADITEVDIDIVRHQGGMIADWAERAIEGDTIGLMGPGGGETVPQECQSVLLAADETALPALAYLLATLPKTCTGHVVTALPRASLHYLPETTLPITCLDSTAFPEKVEDSLKALADNCAPDFCWFAGEYDNAQSLRKVFKQEFGLGKGRQYAISYWKRGRSGDAKGTA
ncbi:siderophore-interacting protein [Labrenzia sp. CE80]|uniref:siderophore-interacting protein n=1 Tax=Labrenzia sp. CE80 TaxID=1788986 RepID=UPI00129BD54E|nr:siderophore-interacting protein [Labrenzia sp. CE80]